MIEFGAEVMVMESSDKGGDDFCFRDVGNRISYLRKTSDVATEELGRSCLVPDRVHIAM